MKRLKDTCQLSAFGQYLTGEQIQRSAVLRRLADRSSVDPSAVAALLPHEQFAAWCTFSVLDNPSAEQLTAVLEAATTLEDAATLETASRALAVIIRSHFRKDLPGSPLERLRSIPSGEPSLPAADCQSAAPSLVPASGTSSAADEGCGPVVSNSTHGSNTPMMSIYGSHGPSIAGSGMASNSAPIADTHRLIRAGGGHFQDESHGGHSHCGNPGFDPGADPGCDAGGEEDRGVGGDSPSPTKQPAPPTPFAGPAPVRGSTGGTSSGEGRHLGASAMELQPRGQAFPSRSTLAALSALSPEPLKATLRHLHLSVSVHLPPRFRVAALQCRAKRAPDAPPDAPPTRLDLSETLTQSYSGPAPASGALALAHPIISTFALLLPSSVPNLRFLSLAGNHLRPTDAIALAGAISTLPSLASLDLSNNSQLTAAAMATLLCSCPNLRTSLTSLSMAGCNRAHPAALSRALMNLDSLAELSFGPAPPRMGDMPVLAPLAEPLARLRSLRSLRLCGFGAALLDLIPRLPFETLTSLDVSSEEDVVAPMHAALAAQAGRMRVLRVLRMQGWSCTTVDALSIDRFVRALTTLPRLQDISMSGAPPHNPDVSTISRLTSLTAVSFKNMSRHHIAPMVLHLPLLRTYCCIKCHSPPATVYLPVETSGAAIVHSLHNIVFRHCDMDTSARVIAYRHMCRVTNVRSLHITYPIGGNLTYFPRTSELRTLLLAMSGLTRLELTCCHRFLAGGPDATLDFSNFSALEHLAVTITDRSESPVPQSFDTSVFRSLGTLTTLRSLDVSHTPLSDLPSFVAELAPVPQLTTLCLLDTAPPAAAQAPGWHGVALTTRLAAALAPHTRLEELTLSFLPLGDAGVATLAPVLGCMQCLQHLGLIKTGVSEVGAAALWSHLRSLPLNRRVLINSAPVRPMVSGAAESTQSESVAVGNGHSSYPYSMM